MVFKTGCIIFGPSKSKMDMVIEALPMKKYVYCSKHLYLIVMFVAQFYSRVGRKKNLEKGGF